MPYVEVHYLEGRTDEQVEELAKAITDAVSKIFKVDKEQVWVEFVEMRKSRFASGGTIRSKK